MTTTSSTFTCAVAQASRREQPRVGEEAGVRDHAVVGPDRLALDVPAALQHLERLDHPERRVGELLAQPADLQDRRQVRDEDAARPQRRDRVLHDAPRLGQVEHDAVEVAARRCPRTRRAPRRVERHVGAEEAVHVLHARGRRSRRGSRSRSPCPVGPIARSSAVVSAPDPTPDSRMRAPGNMSASIRIGPMSFG